MKKFLCLSVCLMHSGLLSMQKNNDVLLDAKVLHHVDQEMQRKQVLPSDLDDMHVVPLNPLNPTAQTSTSGDMPVIETHLSSDHEMFEYRPRAVYRLNRNPQQLYCIAGVGCFLCIICFLGVGVGVLTHVIHSMKR